MSDKKSLLPKELKGVVFVTGLRGLGKTLFSVQTDYPENVCFLDYESKGQYWHEQLKFGCYVDIPAAAAAAAGKGKDFNGRDVWRVTKQTIDNLPENKYTTVIIDTVGDFETALGDEIRFEPQKYGVRPNQLSGGFGGIYPALGVQVESLISRLHSKGVQLIVVTSHVKSAWAANGPVPNKLRAHGNSVWHDRSILELVLVPGQSVVPAALVQKESLAGVALNRETGRFEFKRRLPLKLPECTWAAIADYLKNPADLQNPKPEEVPTEEERKPYSEFFDKEQMEYLIKASSVQVEAQE